MMLSTVISILAGALVDACPDPAEGEAGAGDCAEGEEIVRAARKAAAIPALNRFIDV
jgi:hypothetical protein